MWTRIDIGPARFIKISSPDKELLDCKLVLSDKPHYMVWPNGQGGDDSVNIHQQLDTLFITYVDINSSPNNNDQYHRSVEIFVSEWQQLHVNGASVSIDSAFGNQYPDKQILLTNSKLDFGTDEEDSDHKNEINRTADSTNPFMNNLQLNGLNSSLVMNKGFSIKTLDLGFNGGELNIKNGAFVQSVSGFVSSRTQLNVDGVFLNKMKGLQVK